MLTKKNIISTLLLLIATVLFVQPAFSQDMKKDMKKDKETSFYVTDKGTEYKLAGWATDVVYNPYTFTWMEWSEPVYKKEKVKTVYPVPVSEFDRPPLFSKACLNADDKIECTNSELQAYVVDEDFDYPIEARDRLQEGQEYVTFQLTKNGIIKNITVLSKDENCRNCADTAADIVASMKDMWYPAMKDGKPVTTKITVPFKFKLRETPGVN